MVDAATNEHFKRIRSLCGSLECILTAMEIVEDNSTCVGASVFLMTELKDAIEQCETALIGGTGTDGND